MNFYKSYNKMTKVFIFQICLLVLYCGCTRDPFGRYPDSVKNASPYTKDVYYLGHNFEKQIVFENVARIEASDIWQTFVGDEFNMVVTGHVLLEEENFHDFYIELVSPPLDNEIYEFREADATQHDPKKKQYIFQWNPSSSFLGNDFRKVINLRFQLKILGKVNVSIFDNFPVFVYEKPILTKPAVLSIENPSLVSSGSVCKIKVKVFDSNSSEDYPPIVDFVDVSDRYDASDLITFSNKTQLDDQTWEFEYDFTAPLLEEENQVPYLFEVLAISRFGVSSSTERSQLTIFRDMNNLPEIIGPENITAYTATNSHIELLVQDPFNGELSIDEIISINSVSIPGSFIARKRKEDGYFKVSIIWDIPENTEGKNVSGEYEFLLNMIYRWNGGNSRQSPKLISHAIKANIVPIENLEQSDDAQEVTIGEL